MSSGENRLEEERALISDSQGKGPMATLAVYTKLSGPGWLQSAITLGGGSLGGSLYLGVLLGYGTMWLQPMAMILGIVMLSAISYVTLSTGRRPFEAINSEISPVLGWAWLIGTMMANMVWCMPQFSLGTGALMQNLFPGMTDWLASAILFTLATIVVWSYSSGNKGVQLFELLLKILVGIVVLSFFAVVLRMTFSSEGLPWSEILAGFVPNGLFLDVSPRLESSIAATGQFSEFWRNQVFNPQVATMITATATAVGINMTFLMPYSLLRKKWDKGFRGLAIFDLSTGLFIPYLLATSCVVIASASQFHGRPEAGILSADAGPVAKNIRSGVDGLLDTRLKEELGSEEFLQQFGGSDRSEAQTGALQVARDNLPEADRKMAAILVKRDNQQLAGALEHLSGKTTAHVVFGIGVLAMAVSTIIILMLINGFALCEALGHEPTSNTFRAGCLVAGISGALGSLFLWTGGAKAWLVVPTSMFGAALLPIAYVTFFCMMNSKRLLGDHMPSGVNRLKWNALMLLALSFAVTVSVISIYQSDSTKQLVGFGALAAIVVLSVIFRAKPSAPSTESGSPVESGS
ncbi:MAG: divalent metal cation transporter [Fuerstiella sp.]|nr:divalent metal cation transporter [Fuerstiella sp.]